MISFLNPFFLAFGGALLIPVILHMIQSSRTVRMPFSTIRFLKLAQKRSSTRIRMENFLLWLLRTLLMAMLTLAFAMPMIRTRDFGSLLGRAARDVAIVVDGSYSMDYKMGRQTVWNQAIDLSSSIIEGLGDRDRFCLYLAGDQVTPICEQMTDKREETITRLRALKVSNGSSQLCPATLAALGALDQDGRRVEREIHIITDGQLLPWAQFKKADATAASSNAPPGIWDSSKVRDNTTCYVSLLGAPAPENASPINVELEPKLITAETPCQATVRLLRSGPAQETSVALFVDNKEVGRRSLMLNGGTANETRFMIPPPGPGVHPLRVETPDDSLMMDNVFHLLIRAKEKLPTLCVGSPASTLFLRAALGTSVRGVSAIDVKNVEVSSLGAEPLNAYACVFLCDVMPLSGQDVKRIETYAANGGVVVVFPGDSGSITDYAAWTFLPAIPSLVMDVPLEDRKRLLSWDKPAHPIVTALKEGGAAPVLVIKRQFKCDKLAERAECLVSTGAGYPFLLIRPMGRGAVLQFTVSADRSWSDFPLSPFYLPMTYQLISYAAGVGAGSSYVWATDSLSLSDYLPGFSRDWVLKGPDAKPVSVRNAVVDGETLSYAEGLTLPGIYTVSRPGEPGESPALAINMPRAESDLTPIKADDLPSILGVKALVTTSTKEEHLKKLEDMRIGKTLGELFLWLALLLAVLESIYSNWLMKKGSKLTDSLTIEASGKVKDRNS